MEQFLNFSVKVIFPLSGARKLRQGVGMQVSYIRNRPIDKNKQTW